MVAKIGGKFSYLLTVCSQISCIIPILLVYFLISKYYVGIAAPLLSGLHGKTPLIIMGSCSFLGGLLAVFLPETLGAKLPEKISEIKSLYANPKPWWKWISKSHLKNLRSKNDEKNIEKS